MQVNELRTCLGDVTAQLEYASTHHNLLHEQRQHAENAAEVHKREKQRWQHEHGVIDTKRVAGLEQAALEQTRLRSQLHEASAELRASQKGFFELSQSYDDMVRVSQNGENEYIILASALKTLQSRLTHEVGWGSISACSFSFSFSFQLVL